MRLSEAIRLGAMLKPQGKGNDAMNWMKSNRTCALGAAAEAASITGSAHVGSEGENIYNGLKDRWPELTKYIHCPECGFRYPNLSIWHLNDQHGWTRERIADWVATIEPQEVTAPVEEPQHQEAAS